MVAWARAQLDSNSHRATQAEERVARPGPAAARAACAQYGAAGTAKGTLVVCGTRGAASTARTRVARTSGAAGQPRERSVSHSSAFHFIAASINHRHADSSSPLVALPRCTGWPTPSTRRTRTVCAVRLIPCVFVPRALASPAGGAIPPVSVAARIRFGWQCAALEDAYEQASGSCRLLESRVGPHCAALPKPRRASSRARRPCKCSLVCTAREQLRRPSRARSAHV
jgi:hypothetical protein